jgi:nucleoside-diphosphate-sugar epimerase
VTVLVTGGTGFIGFHVVERLRAEGRTVRCPVRSIARSKGLSALGAEVVEADIRSGAGLDRAARGVEEVIHLAGVVRAWGRQTYFDTNVEGTRRLALAASAAGARKFLLVSSLAAAGPGDPGGEVTEETVPRPINDYGRSKLAAEGALAGSAGDMEFAVVRPAIVYGPRERDLLLLFRLASRRRRIPWVGPRGAAVSLIHVDDLADLCLACLARAPAGRLYMASDGEAHAWSVIIETIGRALGRDVRPVRIPAMPLWPIAVLSGLLRPFTARPPILSLDKWREGSRRWWVCSPARARRELGWAPRISFEDGARSTAEWYREHRWL